MATIYVECKYRNGDRELSTINDALIMTEAEAIQRGFLGEDGVYENSKTRPTFFLRFPRPSDGHLIRAGTYMRFSCPELGLINQTLYILTVRKGEDHYIEMTGEYYIEIPGAGYTQGSDILVYEDGDVLELE
jgi:hypothetical protein